MFYIRQSNYAVLVFCLVLVAFIVRSGILTAPSLEQEQAQKQRRAQQAKASQKQELQQFVSGAIGIQEERGDTVHVLVR